VFGKSSGGYGALFLAMHWPDIWGAAASHAGDVGFEWVYRPEFPLAARLLAGEGGDITAFIRRFWAANRPAGAEFAAMLVLAMAASYDPDPANPARIRLPFDIATLEMDPARWDRWLAFDPLNLIEDRHEALNGLLALHIDVGSSDQYNIQFGTRRLIARLEALGVAGRFEEFDGTHSGIDWRLDRSLPFLARALETACAETQP
jgi:S-formylglutathione hydrolase FrmB